MRSPRHNRCSNGICAKTLACRSSYRSGCTAKSSGFQPDAIETLPRIVRHYGEPFADATAVPTFYLARMARRHVTVALNGDGGDEAEIVAGLQSTKAAFGRSETVTLRLNSEPATPSTTGRLEELGDGQTPDRRELQILLVKNPAGANEVLRDVIAQRGHAMPGYGR